MFKCDKCGLCCTQLNGSSIYSELDSQFKYERTVKNGFDVKNSVNKENVTIVHSFFWH